MCQSKADGGRRCAGKDSRVGNYPSFVKSNDNDKVIELSASSFDDNPAVALHAAVLSARTGYPLSPETIQAGQKASKKYSDIPKAKVWEQWNFIALSEKPSLALDAIHKMGWEDNFPELKAIRGVPQSPVWHPEGSVEVHTAQAADIAASQAKKNGLNESETRVAVMAAICHDLGKSTATQISEDGKISSHGHDEVGYGYAKSFLENIGASKDVKAQVPTLVNEHMCHINEPTPRLVRRLEKRLNDGNTTLEAWARLAEADKAGRGTAGVFGEAEKWLEIKEDINRKARAKENKIIDGNVLKEHGVRPFSKYGEIIKKAEAEEATGKISSTEDFVSWLRKEGYVS